MSEPWRALAAAIANQAVNDIEAASKLQDRVLAAAKRRAKGRYLPSDERLLQRWAGFEPISAVAFFQSPLWYWITDVLGIDDELPPRMIHKIQQLEHAIIQIETLRGMRVYSKEVTQ